MEHQQLTKDTHGLNLTNNDPNTNLEQEFYNVAWLKPSLGPHREDLNAKRIAFHAGPCWIKILVADRVAGSIIGKGGKVITDIENSTGCIMKLSPGMSLNETSMSVYILYV